MFSSSFCSSLYVSLILDMTFYNSLFIIKMSIAYVDYIFSIVGVVLCLCSCLYSAHPDLGVGGRYCVSMVLIHCLSIDAPYILGHVLDHEGDFIALL